MPVPLAPCPTPPAPYTPPAANGAQSQLVCSGCRNLLLYPVGATSVCCAVCNAVTAVPPPGTEMAQLVCGGCHTLLMYIRGATSVQCSCCHTVNLALEANQVAHVNCGNCRMLLMYQYGARSVKCAVCNFVTSVGITQFHFTCNANKKWTICDKKFACKILYSDPKYILPSKIIAAIDKVQERQSEFFFSIFWADIIASP
ncbi:Protein LSD1 [Hibiscus syriacus]|uniref:Protein LSD1 n=1 Tax=Hibiscus syriacus TaxID=106335 RepID=A0A6A2ZPU1_HIBSY|nr:Protein LSD1 [Hibiscus syriacus]